MTPLLEALIMDVIVPAIVAEMLAEADAAENIGRAA